MNIYVHIWQYLSEFLEWATFQAKAVEKIKKTRLMFSNFFKKEKCRLWDNVEKYSRDRQTTDDNIIRRMLFARWTPKATITPSE